VDAPIVNARLRIPKVKAIRRQRVDDLLDHAWQHRLTMVLAPAGSGKTTAIAELAMRAAHTVGWLAATGCDGSSANFVKYINNAMHAADERIEVGATTVDDVARSLEPFPELIGLIIDDVHALSGTPAERSLAELIDRLPEQCRIVLAGRREPAFDISRLRLAGQVFTVGSDELRFRSWEAEQLFRDLYETWLRPDDIARLSHRLDGWAAGLQLFHLAARNLQPGEQRRLIDRLSGQARLVRDYLAANVLEPIAAELRSFLIDTCVLGVVTPDLADELRGATGSAEHLRELAQGHLFTVAVDDETYRYHEVLRAQLEVLLHERDGPRRAAERYRAAAAMLHRDGFIYDALRCYAHAADWEAIRQIASPAGELPPSPSRWISELPSSIVADDPWLLLARAGAELAGGQHRAAAATYVQAETRSIGSELADECRFRRSQLMAWTDPSSRSSAGWSGVTRAGSRRDPLGAAAQLDDAGSPLALIAASVLRLFGGEPAEASAALSAALREQSMDEGTFSVGLVALALAQLLTGAGDREMALDEAEMRAERAGAGWAARLARAGLALTSRPLGIEEAARVADLCLGDGDRWGEGFAALFGGLGSLRRGLDAGQLLARAAATFEVLDAPVLQRVVIAAANFHRLSAPRPTHAERDRGIGDEATARQLLEMFMSGGCSRPGLHGRDANVRAGTRDAADDAPHVAPQPIGRPPVLPPQYASLQPPTPIVHQPATSGTAAVRPIEVRCFGAFELLVNGVEVPLTALRPRARTLLRLLAINVGSSIHREALVEALWPESDVDTGVHNLQVAVSAVRKTLAEAGIGDNLGVVRHGEAYRLALPRLDACDHARFLEDVKRARTALARGDEKAAYAAATRALADYRGELLSEDGPAEWVLAARSRAATQREAVAVIAAKAMIAQSSWSDAVELCETILHERPYADEIWRLLVQAQRERGDRAAAAQAQTRYDKMLEALA
jgi:DNA-binding SARP family transcriptional activator